MRNLTPEECEFIAGGDGPYGGGTSEYPPEIVVVASPPPYYPPYYPPYEPPQPPSPPPYYDPGSGGGGGGGSGGGTTTGAEGSSADVWVKAGADISNLSDEMEDTLDDVVDAAEDLGLPHVVITSGSDGTHGAGSLHASGNALDFRGNNITVAQGQAWASALQTALGSNYDVIFETFADSSNNHLHIEYDPD